MKRLNKALLLIMAGIMCVVMASCQSVGQQEWPVEALNAEEYSYYADNANVFADDVLESGAQFLYVQLACAAESSLSEEEISIANDNADGIVAMLNNDYHDVLDAREIANGIADRIGSKMKLNADAKILVIGDAAGEKQVYEELAATYNNIDYLNSLDIGRDDYDKIYNTATVAGWDAVIVANDTTAFHTASFPFGAK